MDAYRYQTLAMRTNDGMATKRLLNKTLDGSSPFEDSNFEMGDILNACLGLSGEVGELNDMVKKWVFHEKVLDVNHLKKECGDILWYIALLCESFKWDMGEVMQTNIDKLIARYPIDEGFTVNRANNRAENDV